MQEYGKIFVVVAVLVVILIGVFAYLFSLDRKVNKLRKDVEERTKRDSNRKPE